MRRGIVGVAGHATQRERQGVDSLPCRFAFVLAHPVRSILSSVGSDQLSEVSMSQREPKHTKSVVSSQRGLSTQVRAAIVQVA